MPSGTLNVVYSKPSIQSLGYHSELVGRDRRTRVANWTELGQRSGGAMDSFSGPGESAPCTTFSVSNSRDEISYNTIFRDVIDHQWGGKRA